MVTRVFGAGIGEPGGSNGEIQYNNDGVLDGIDALTYSSNALSLTNSLVLKSSTTPSTYSILKQSDAEGVASASDTRLGLDESLQYFILCDKADIDQDFGLGDPGHPTVKIYNATSNISSSINYNSIQSSSAFTAKGAAGLMLYYSGDRVAGDGVIIGASSANIELTDANGEQSVVKIEGESAQTGTAAVNALEINLNQTTLGDATTGTGNHLIKAQVDSGDIFTVDNRGAVNAKASEFIDEMWNGVAPEWATRTTTGSGAAQSRNNGWYRLTTGAGNDNEESLDWNDICTFQNTQRPSFEVRLDLEQVTVLRCAVGLIEASGGGDDEYINCVFDTDVDGNWNFNCDNTSGTPTTVAGSAATTNEVTIRMQMTDSDTEVNCYLDGVYIGQLTSKVPTSALQPYIEVITREAGVHYVEFDCFKIWQDRS